MHIADVKISNTWAALSTLVNIEEDAEYTIMNSSPDDLYFVEGDTTPAAGVIGSLVLPGNFVKYKKGSQANLYIKNGYPVSTSGDMIKKQIASNISINKVG